MRILIVDDDKTFCQLLAELLEDKGHEVEWTSRGLEGYKMSQRKYYDLFIFDVRMPILLGTELAAGLKEQSPGTKIILISAFADESLRNAARSLGIPLLSKPFTTETFLDLVERTGAVKSNDTSV
jgi:DNA-binding response OmpR family regulator